LIEASSNGRLSVVKYLVEHKANVEAKDTDGVYLDSASAVLFSLLCILFACGLWMLMCGVDVMLLPGRTALISASSNGYLPVVKHLVEHKANIEAKNKYGMCFRFRFHCSV
jgi:ankyrin repeat protein